MDKGIQTHHISYDPEITIDILKDLHVKYHGHGTGKVVGEGKVSSNERLTKFTIRFPKTLLLILKERCRDFGYASPTEMIRMSVLEKLQRDMPWILEDILKSQEAMMEEINNE